MSVEKENKFQEEMLNIKVDGEYSFTEEDIRGLGASMKKMMPFGDQVDFILSDIAKMLKEKNNSYGNSALDPIRVFSKVSAGEQLKVRIDDKLSRIQQGGDDLGEDTINDLIGYLVLYKIHTGDY